LVQVHTLANGARVVCDPIPGFETLALSVVAGRGARWEPAEQSGWAHLLEHMVFKGAGERSAREIARVIEAAGGQINAATGYERTSFQVRALKGGAPLAMEVLSDLVLRPRLDPAELEREKGVVVQEIAEAADDPDDLVFENAQALAFGDSPLGRPVLGAAGSVGAASASALGAFRAQLYSPDQLVISAAGATCEDELLALAETWFAGAPISASPPAFEPAAFCGGQTAPRAELEQAHLVFMLPAFGVRDDAYFALRLFAEALGGGMSSRLFQEVREVHGLAYNIDAFAETYADVGVLGLYAGAGAADAAKAAQLSARQIKALTAGANAEELDCAKAQLKAALFMARESALARAEQSAGQLLVFDRLIPPSELSERIDAVTLADLRQVGERLLAPGRSARSVLGPAKAAEAAAAFERELAA
jgi:predicted Zn-dependent peptidase